MPRFTLEIYAAEIYAGTVPRVVAAMMLQCRSAMLQLRFFVVQHETLWRLASAAAELETAISLSK